MDLPSADEGRRQTLIEAYLIAALLPSAGRAESYIHVIAYANARRRRAAMIEFGDILMDAKLRTIHSASADRIGENELGLALVRALPTVRSDAVTGRRHEHY